MTDEKKKQSFSDPYARVDMQSINISGEEIKSKMAVRVMADDGTWSKNPSIVSSDYKLYTNQVARDVADDVMSRSDYQWKELHTLWDGRRYCAMFITQASIIDIPIPRTPTAYSTLRNIHLGMAIRNSYDGSSIFGFELFACDAVCTNRFHSRNRFGYFAFRYDKSSDGFNVADSLQNLSTGVGSLVSLSNMLIPLREAPLKLRDVVKVRNKDIIPVSLWGSVIEKLGTQEESLFGFLSALTDVASHEIRGFNTLSVSEDILEHFYRMERV